MKFFRYYFFQHWILACILLFAGIVLFYRLDHFDMVGDDAHYSVRAIGMVDFLFVSLADQPTPIQWFKELPWWANLSWHDHPLPLFLIQSVFLSIKSTVFFAKLPYALMALGTILLTYLIWSLQEDRKTGILAALFLVLNAQFIWSGRVAYMESGVVFFLSLCLLAFFRFLKEPRAWWQFGLALGFALSIKFTTLFIIPTIFCYLLIFERKIFNEKRFYYALLIALALCLPIIIYNSAMYMAKGHFSLQFARLLGQSSPWHMSGARTGDYGAAIAGLFRNLGEMISWPYLIAAAAAAIWSVIRRKASFPLVGIFFLTLQLAFIGGSYLLALYSIWIAPLLAVAMSDAIQKIPPARKVFYRTAQALVCVFCLYLAGFVVSSHSFVTPAGSIGLGHSAASSRNYGIFQLEQYLETVLAEDKTLTPLDPFAYIKDRSPRLRKYMLNIPREERERRLAHSRMVLFDGNISWFARVWLLEHRRFYNNAPYVAMNEIKLLRQMHIDQLYVVVATEYAPQDAVKTDRASAMEKRLIKEGHAARSIYRDDGKVAFKIYHVDTTKLAQINSESPNSE